MADPLSDVEHTETWPEPVRARLQRSREEFLAAARPPVLDLSTPDARALVAEVAAGRSSPSVEYRSIVSVASLPLFPDVVTVVRAMKSLLVLRGDLFFDEPIGRPGTLSLVLGTIASGAPAVRGLHLNRDIVGALRAGGLEVISVKRSTLPTRCVPLRRFAPVSYTHLRAHET
ncbi:MAG: hypothetical protein N2037_05890, partial [Acidimicrobiales bacterium]|nr:hypothetical protein [Acidimicrobiales bacterium]